MGTYFSERNTGACFDATAGMKQGEWRFKSSCAKMQIARNRNLLHDIPHPAISIDLLNLKIISSNLSQILHLVQQNPSVDQIHRYFVQQIKLPWVERNSPADDYTCLWTRNVNSENYCSSCNESWMKITHIAETTLRQCKFCTCTRVSPACPASCSRD